MQEYIFIVSIALEWIQLYCILSFAVVNLGFTVANELYINTTKTFIDFKIFHNQLQNICVSVHQKYN
jgi:hypothetical protein